MAGRGFAGDVIPALAIVAPGFLVLYLVATFRGRRLSGNPLFVTLGSILVSGVLALFFLAWNGLRDGGAIVTFVFQHPLRSSGGTAWRARASRRRSCS